VTLHRGFQVIGELTDGQLLERFATEGGDVAEEAFAALVQRHGPMVLRVCRSVLANPHDTQDAFQASFLVLVRKARSLWVRDSLGPWLHQVALRTASAARSAAARRRRLERLAAQSATLEDTTMPCQETEQLLHAEIDRLPERFRAPVILCDLEGRTHEQVARHLGWPVGTVKSRLSRAHERLRDRLRRRGLAPEGGLQALALGLTGLDELMPAALVESTTLTAVRFGACRVIANRSVASLAQGVLRAMFLSRILKTVPVFLVASATVTGAGLLAARGTASDDPRGQEAVKDVTKPGSDVPVSEVKPGKLKVSVIENGTLEPARWENELCQVEGSTTIISILPEGSKVKKGDLVCELDSAALKDQLLNQKIKSQAAFAAYENAKLAREVAEIALKEYKEGIYLQDQATLRGGIKLAESALPVTQAELERTRRARGRLSDAIGRKEGPPASGDILAELELENRIDSLDRRLMREKLALETAQSKLNLLNNFTKAKTTMDLKSKVEQSLSAEKARGLTYQLEREKETRLEKQILNCQMRAPISGVVIYANDPARPLVGRRPFIEEGATVRERQVIFKVFDLDAPMLVNTKVREAMVDRLKPGQKARIEVHAFLGRTFEGVVTEVFPLPDPTNNFSQQLIKVYTTKIKLEKNDIDLRPGMSATVEIPIAERDNVMTVPIKAVLPRDGKDQVKDQVAVRKSDGTFEWRDVTVGGFSGPLLEITQGLKPGEQVATDARALLSEAERQRSIPPTKPAAAKRGTGKTNRDTSN
jgi:HlyD family secretion protein